jgi:N-methylhydantoinase A
MPLYGSYLRSVEDELAARGFEGELLLMQSNGGVARPEALVPRPVLTLNSGPVGGAVAAAWLARRLERRHVVACDIGGTSTDTTVIVDHAVPWSDATEVAYYPVVVPTADIRSIGAGGGSIAALDAGGALRVGPESAGAHPGPACYGRGGSAATVTDANLFLGRLGPEGLLGGSMRLDTGAAAAAIGALAHALALSSLESARGIVAVVNANMAGAVRLVTVQRGVDPAGLALLAFGGAGPLHAGALARELGIRTVLVPPSPGLLCALGLLVEDLRQDAVRTWVARLDVDTLERLDERFSEMETEAVAWLERERVAPARRSLERWLDMRYTGQNYELLVPVPAEVWTPRRVEPLRERFLAMHEAAYGYAAPDEPIQVVNARLVARGRPDPPSLPRIARAGGDVSAAMSARRRVFSEDAGDFVDCPVYDRRGLGAGHVIAGPAVVEQFDSTTLVHPGQRAEVDDLGFLLITEA